MTLSNKLKPNEFIELMVKYASLAQPKDVNPMMLWGSPGVGKSQAMAQVGKILEKNLKKKVNITDVRLLLFNPVDLRGIPVADDKKELAIWLKPQIFQMDESEDVINILILDEISAAPPSVQAAAYQMTLDRQVGEHRIPDNCLIMCAGNKVTDKSVAYKMPKALANRLSHIDIEVDVDDWKKWAIPHEIDSRILAYINFNNGNLYKFDPNIDDNSFATPRSWEKVDNVLKVLDLKEGMPVIAGLIGEGMAFDFLTYTEVFTKIPDIEEIIKGKCKDKVTRPDVNFALTSAMVSKVSKINDDQLFNLLDYGLDYLPTEFTVLLFKDLVKSGNEIKNRVLSNKAFDKLVKLHGGILAELKN